MSPLGEQPSAAYQAAGLLSDEITKLRVENERLRKYLYRDQRPDIAVGMAYYAAEDAAAAEVAALRARAERAESALGIERAVNATLVRQIQAVRDLRPSLTVEEPVVPGKYPLVVKFVQHLNRAEVLALLSPQNQGKIR